MKRSQRFAAQGDLTQTSNVRALFPAAKQEFCGVDIAINTTGMVIKKPILDCAEEDYDTIFTINFKAAFFFM